MNRGYAQYEISGLTQHLSHIPAFAVKTFLGSKLAAFKN